MTEKERNNYFDNGSYAHGDEERAHMQLSKIAGTAAVHGQEPVSTQTGEEVSSMEDLLEAAGTDGWRNYLIYFFCAWASFVSPWHTLSYQFLGATPQYWCDIPELQQANWTIDQIVNYSVPSYSPDSRLESCSRLDLDYSKVATFNYEDAVQRKEEFILNEGFIECEKRFFDPEEPDTVVTKWDLVCDRRVLYSTTQATIHVGKLVGSIIMGYFLSMFGRKRTLAVCMPLYLIVGVITAWSPNVEVYITLKFIISTIGMSFYLAGMILSFELCSTKQRSLIGALFALPWAVGYMVLPAVAYFIRPFLQLQIAVTAPILLVFPCLWIIPESPRWYVLKGRFEEAIQVLQKIADFNKRSLPPKEKMIRFMKKLHMESNQGKEAGNSVLNSIRRFAVIFVNFSWLWKILILFFSWFSSSMVYYGVSLNPPDLSQDKYLFIFLGGALEIPSYIILWPSNKYLGRKKTLVGLFGVCALAIFTAAGLTYNEDSLGEHSSSNIHTILLVMSLLGKFAITAAFQVVWIYTTELIPTQQRSLIVGSSSSFSRAGSIASPYIVDILGEKVHWAPSAIFGSFSVVTAILAAFLPETKNLELTESVKGISN